MKRILILGGTGFLGKALQKTFGFNNNVICVGSLICDLRDKFQVKSLYQKYQPNIIVNLAAVVGGIQANQRSPGRFFYDNMLINLNAIHEAKDLGSLEKFVQIATTCSYGAFCPVPFKEDKLFTEYPEPTNAPYGVAKLSILTMLEAYRREYGLQSNYLIPTNLYGPNDNFNLDTSHVIPAIIRKVYEARENGISEVTLFGSGNATRDFLYVDDCAIAIYLAIEKNIGLAPINIGSGREISIHRLAEIICSLMDYKGKIIWDRSKPDGQPRRCLDTSKAKQLLNFTPQVSLENGLKTTIDWYYKNVNAVK